jgi:hypothetical protein
VVGGGKSHNRPFDVNRNFHRKYVDVLFLHIDPQLNKPSSHLRAVDRTMFESLPQTTVVVSVKVREKVVLESRVFDCVEKIRPKSDSGGNLGPKSIENIPFGFAGRKIRKRMPARAA